MHAGRGRNDIPSVDRSATFDDTGITGGDFVAELPPVFSFFKPVTDDFRRARIMPPKKTQRPSVLDVGQCNADHHNISAMLQEAFDAQIIRAHTAADAMAAAREHRLDLVLVNRILDADHTEGLKVIHGLKTDDATRTLPVMLVSNYADAQEQAMGLGAVRGFGKAALSKPETVNLLANYLRR